MALPKPTARQSLWVPPSPRPTFHLRSRQPNAAWSAATRMSAATLKEKDRNGPKGSFSGSGKGTKILGEEFVQPRNLLHIDGDDPENFPAQRMRANFGDGSGCVSLADS